MGSRLSSSLTAAILVLSVAGGCAEEESDRPGGVQLQLSLPSGVTLNSISWNVLSSTGAVLASGSTNTTGPRATPSLSVSVPQGTGERVSVAATTTAGASCAGTSDPFNVTRGTSVPVSLMITCTAPPASTGLGTVVVTTVVDPGHLCPTLTSWAAVPNGAGQFDVSVSASIPDGEAVTYAWAATEGAFSDPAAATTRYICSSPGGEVLSVTLTGQSCVLHISLPAVACP